MALKHNGITLFRKKYFIASQIGHTSYFSEQLFLVNNKQKIQAFQLYAMALYLSIWNKPMLDEDLLGFLR